MWLDCYNSEKGTEIDHSAITAQSEYVADMEKVMIAEKSGRNKGGTAMPGGTKFHMNGCWNGASGKKKLIAGKWKFADTNYLKFGALFIALEMCKGQPVSAGNNPRIQDKRFGLYGRTNPVIERMDEMARTNFKKAIQVIVEFLENIGK
jgi:hypothetical protein